MKAYKTFLSLSILLLLSSSSFSQYKNWFKFTLTSGTYKDESIIRFCQTATDTFDYDWDAYKIKNGGNTPNLYSRMEKTSYSINSLPDSFINRDVALNVELAFSGTYTINFKELKATDSLCIVTLIDNLLNTKTELKINPNYTFEGEAGLHSDRFVINFKKKSLEPIADDSDTSNTELPDSISNQNVVFNSKFRVACIGDRLTIDMEEISNEVFVSINDLSGKEVVISKLEAATKSIEFIVPTNGFHIVKVIAGKHQYYGKIFIGDF